MGRDTKAIIRRGVTLEEIKAHAEKKFGDVTVATTHDNDFFYLTFPDTEEKDRTRQLAVFLDSDMAFRDYGISGVLLSLGCWGGSVEIVKHFVDEYGGYIDKDDCDSEDFEPYNLDEFYLGRDMTREDELRNELAKEVGFENMVKAMRVFENYK